MTTETKEIDQIIAAMRQWKRDSQWKDGIGRIAELAERVVHLEDENAAMKKQRSDDGWGGLAEMTIQRDLKAETIVTLCDQATDRQRELRRIQREWKADTDALDVIKGVRDRLVEQLAELTKSRDYHRSHFLTAMEEVATLKQTIEDQKQKCSRAIIELVTSMPMTDRIAKALAVLNE